MLGRRRFGLGEGGDSRQADPASKQGGTEKKICFGHVKVLVAVADWRGRDAVRAFARYAQVVVTEDEPCCS
ncbi:hypothetical protein BOS5A_210107 [Bosea sp. EC-HK365B]|nr:hypothetical protein BOS5A_210107 [Bosea sp. EC-HK365B]